MAIWRYMLPMRALIASLVMLAFAVTGTANCALAQSGGELTGAGVAESAGSARELPPCHEPAGETAHGGHVSLHSDDDCTGGAACIDCALASGLSVDTVFLEGLALHGAPQPFIVKTARTGLFAHDPPPPRA